MKSIYQLAVVAMALSVCLAACNKKNNAPPPSIDGEYEGLSTIITIASQDEWTDSVVLTIVDDEYEYLGQEALNDGSGYLLLTYDSVRFIDWRTTLFEHWDWILRGTYKYSLSDSTLTLFRQTDTKTYQYDLKVQD